MKRFITFIMAIILATTMTFAHSGRTDGSGGHKDNRNASGLGYYHYHCGGYPAHLHSGGSCPYSGGTSSSTYKSQNSAPKVKQPEIIAKNFSYNDDLDTIDTILKNNTTYVAVSGLSNFMNLGVEFKKAEKTITIGSDLNQKRTTFSLNSKDAFVQNDRTFVPLRAVVENLGYTLNPVDGIFYIS